MLIGIIDLIYPLYILTDSLFGNQSLEMQRKSKARLMGWNKNVL